MPKARTENALPCICCKKELGNIDPKGNQPSGGLEFTTRGHYGSTVFDPVVGIAFLAVNVCDECLVAEAQAGRVLIGERQVTTKTKTVLKKWDGHEDGVS